MGLSGSPGESFRDPPSFLKSAPPLNLPKVAVFWEMPSVLGERHGGRPRGALTRGCIGRPTGDGALILMADCRVVWLTKHIDPVVFRALGTPHGNEQIPAGILPKPPGPPP